VSTAIDPRYPVGKFSAPQDAVPAEERAQFLNQVAEAPARLRAAVQGLTETQLDTPYRDGGWSSRQVVHHVADSHMNAFIRFKLGLTEDNPTIKPYPEHLWADLADQKMSIDVSLPIVDNVHQRWVTVLRSMKEADWARTFNHPEMGVQRLDRALALYAWHGRHHAAHITSLREQNSW
jgi:DinB superfamily